VDGPRLKLIGARAPAPSKAPRRREALGLALLLLLAGGLATLLGADSARHSRDVSDLARGVLERALQHGADCARCSADVRSTPGRASRTPV
jgi:hypothetical protein